jgi:hypothetical protein
MSRRRWLILAVVAAAGAGLTAFGLRQKPLADVGVAYMARVGCACHFIAGRTLESCQQDREAGMDLVRLEADAAQRRLTARVPLLARASATHTPGLGCMLDPP